MYIGARCVRYGVYGAFKFLQSSQTWPRVPHAGLRGDWEGLLEALLAHSGASAGSGSGSGASAGGAGGGVDGAAGSGPNNNAAGGDHGPANAGGVAGVTNIYAAAMAPHTNSAMSGALRALAVLRRPSVSRELVYRFAPGLVAAAPAEAVDFFVSARPPLEPLRLIPALLRCGA